MNILKRTPYNKCEVKRSMYILITTTEISHKHEIQIPYDNEQGHKVYNNILPKY